MGCKVLGLIHKQVTGPLWRKMVNEKNALSMTPHYKQMIYLFEKWSQDPTSFLNGSEYLFSSEDEDKNYLHNDQVYQSLISDFAQTISMVIPLLKFF